MKVLISHIRNEEYMLNWWIPHHLEKFDEAYIIDYGSTDNTLDMIREMAPHWRIIKPFQEKFVSVDCDYQIFQIEQIIQAKYPGAVAMALTITEFLVGNTKFLDSVNGRYEKYILSCQMCDRDEELYVEPDPNISLINQRTFGYPEYYDETVQNEHDLFDLPIWKNSIGKFTELKISPRYTRCIRNGPYSIFNIGRHYWEPGLDIESRLKIACYYYSPMTKSMIERKCKLQENISQTDLDSELCYQHLGITEETILKRMKHIRSFGKDLREDFEKLEALQ
jgi:hypothetical protein